MIDENAGRYNEIKEFRKSSKGSLIASETKHAMECYLEKFIRRDDNESLTYKTLVSSYGEAEYQVVSLPRRAVLLSLFGKILKTTSKFRFVLALLYEKTDLQHKLTWCLVRLTRILYDSDEKKIKGQKIALTISLRDLMISEGATMACSEWRAAV